MILTIEMGSVLPRSDDALDGGVVGQVEEETDVFH
jgi:hypothetical protein